MNTTRFALSVIAVFAFVFGFQYLVHGVALSDTYEATARLWRPMEDHTKYFHFMLMSQLALSFMITYIFVQNYEGKGVSEGLRYGLYVGLLLAALDIGKYCYMPVPASLIMSWMGASLLTGVGAGAALAAVYKK